MASLNCEHRINLIVLPASSCPISHCRVHRKRKYLEIVNHFTLPHQTTSMIKQSFQAKALSMVALIWRLQVPSTALMVAVLRVLAVFTSMFHGRLGLGIFPLYPYVCIIYHTNDIEFRIKQPDRANAHNHGRSSCFRAGIPCVS